MTSKGTALTERPIQAVTEMTAGPLALAMMSDEDFDQRLAALTKGLERVKRIQRALMVSETDYGVIPGTAKPTLLKPGAEKLCAAYGLIAEMEPTAHHGDGVMAPPVKYVVRCTLHIGAQDGPVAAVGHGSANSWETRYRYRTQERTCPACGVSAIIKGKTDWGGGWLCWAKRSGCGAKFKDDDPAILEQVVGKVENPDQHDLDNTCLKMAEKRAYVDATLRATATSGLFAQDLEDDATNGVAVEAIPNGHEETAAQDAPEDDAAVEERTKTLNPKRLTVKFGHSKGHLPAQLAPKDLAYHIQAAEKAIDDPKKERFLDSNKEWRHVLLAEREDRKREAEESQAALPMK